MTFECIVSRLFREVLPMILTKTFKSFKPTKIKVFSPYKGTWHLDFKFNKLLEKNCAMTNSRPTGYFLRYCMELDFRSYGDECSDVCAAVSCCDRVLSQCEINRMHLQQSNFQDNETFKTWLQRSVLRRIALLFDSLVIVSAPEDNARYIN